MKRLVLLLNIGTPDDPSVPAVRRYLTEFLSDPRVLTIPAILRWLLVRVIIVPFRAPKSAHAYQKVWTKRGSPLMVHSEDLAKKVQELMPNDVVRVAMRYGSPSIENAIRDLDNLGVTEIVGVPMFPQFSSAATESATVELKRILTKHGVKVPLRMAHDFYEHPEFIRAQAEVVRAASETFHPDHILMSYHGLPESHVKATDPSGKHCLSLPSCCDAIVSQNRKCYRAQSFATSRSLAKELGINSDGYTVSFQSRLAGQPWIQPFTDIIINDLKARGVKRLLVVCPSFVADCLETVEEIGIRCKDDWKALGGGDFYQAGCVNSSDTFARAVVSLVRDAR